MDQLTGHFAYQLHQQRSAELTHEAQRRHQRLEGRRGRPPDRHVPMGHLLRIEQLAAACVAAGGRASPGA